MPNVGLLYNRYAHGQAGANPAKKVLQMSNFRRTFAVENLANEKRKCRSDMTRVPRKKARVRTTLNASPSLTVEI